MFIEILVFGVALLILHRYYPKNTDTITENDLYILINNNDEFVGNVAWSNYFNSNIICVEYYDDNDWTFIVESDTNKIKYKADSSFSSFIWTRLTKLQIKYIFNL